MTPAGIILLGCLVALIAVVTLYYRKDTLMEQNDIRNAEKEEDRANAIEDFTRLAELSRNGVDVLSLVGHVSSIAVANGVLDAGVEQRLLNEAITRDATPTDAAIADLADALKAAVEQQTQSDATPQQVLAADLRNMALMVEKQPERGVVAENRDYSARLTAKAIVAGYLTLDQVDVVVARAVRTSPGYAAAMRDLADLIEKGGATTEAAA